MPRGNEVEFAQVARTETRPVAPARRERPDRGNRVESPIAGSQLRFAYRTIANRIRGRRRSSEGRRAFGTQIGFAARTIKSAIARRRARGRRAERSETDNTVRT